METITDHLYLIQETCSVYAVNAGGRTVLIDCGTHLRPQSLEEAGLPSAEDILLTHFHRDQCAAAAHFPNARITIPFAERRFLEQADLQRAAYDIWDNYEAYYPCFGPLQDLHGRSAKDYETLNCADLSFEVLPLPGHTFGSVGYLFEVDGRRALACGDLLSSSDKIRDYYWAQWRYMDFQGHTHLLESVKRVEELDVELILPGHGRPFRHDEMQGRLRAALEEIYELFYGKPYSYFRPKFRQLTLHVFEVENSGANTYIVKDDSGHALCIDSGYVSNFSIGGNPHRYIDNLTPHLETELGITKVEWFLPSHYHDDHLAGLPALRARYDTQVLSSPELEDIIQHPERFDMPCQLPEGVPVAQTVDRDETFTWRGIDFRMEQFPGQTLYHHLISFTVDDTKFLCIGDNLSGLCFAEKRDWIHSFIPKNRTPVSSYRDMPRQIKERQPDLLLTGHGGAVDCDTAQVARWEKWMDRWTELFADIIDRPHPNLGMDPRFIEFYPYKVRVRPGQTVAFELRLLNHEDQDAACRIEFRSVDGVGLSPKSAQVDIPAGEQVCQTIEAVFPETFSTHSLPILADVTWNGRPLGEVAEAVAYW